MYKKILAEIKVGKLKFKIKVIKARLVQKITVNKSLPGALGRWHILAFILAFAFVSPGASVAVESISPDPANLKADESTDTSGRNLEIPAPKSEWGTGVHKSYVIPALEIVGLDAFVNGYDRLVYSDQTENGRKVYSTNFATFWHNAAHGRWEIDHDNFKMNQLMHPYHGALYFGLARSSGLNYWESLGYSIFGSFLWETAGETTRPSKNDMVASGIGGALFGEPLYRMASLLLENGGEEPGFWREAGAALISPPTGFNRLVFGERFKPVFPSRNPAVFWYMQAGATLNINRSGHGSPLTVQPNEAKVDYAMSYGLPGKQGYSYTRPFDYFRFELSSLNSLKNPFENVMVHGLLIGKDYEIGDSYRGVWGLYGSYDYISPHFFRVSTSAASIGTTGQWWLSRSVALQGTGLAGIGFGSGGTTAGSGQRDYHYGMTPQGLLALRFIFGNTAKLDATVREYFVSSVAATENGTENILRGTLALIVRIFGRHALGIQYVTSRRDAKYSGLPEIEQRAQTFSLVYTFLSDTNFKAVEWRDIPENQK